MLRVKGFSNVPEEMIEYKVNRWLKERQEKIGAVNVVSVSQSQDGEYVSLTIFYKQK